MVLVGPLSVPESVAAPESAAVAESISVPESNGSVETSAFVPLSDVRVPASVAVVPPGLDEHASAKTPATEEKTRGASTRWICFMARK